MHKIIYIISFFWVAFTVGQAFPEGKAGDTPSNPPKSQDSEIIIAGKIFCPLKRHVLIPFNCTIISVNARSGQKVKRGEVLARFRLEPEASLELNRRVSSFKVQDLEIRLAETKNNLAKQEDKYREIKELYDHNMASPQSLAQVERDIELLQTQLKYIQDRLPEERGLVEKDRAVLEELLGNNIRNGHVPQVGALKAPFGCRVIWVHPDLRKDAEFKKETRAFDIGTMDPMIIKAHIHEIEVVQINIGDVADFTLESIPDRKFEAKVSRISWSTLTPQLDRPSYYEVEFEVPNPEYILREGLKGRIVFQKK